MQYIALTEAKERKSFGCPEVRKVFSSKRPSTKYEPAGWELSVAEDRLSFYKEISGIQRPRVDSEDRFKRFVLSIDSICRRSGSVAFPTRKDYWRGIISDRLASKIRVGLVDRGYMTPCEIQVGKYPMVYDFSIEFQRLVPVLPAGETEGRNIADRKHDMVRVKRIATEDGAGDYGEFSPEWRIDEVRQEMRELNLWFSSQWHRVQGVDDPYHHRVFHHSLAWGGRLYSEFTRMDRETQRPLVRIDGEETEEADLKGSYLSLFLLWKGRRELPRDVYQEGVLSGYDRTFLKQIFIRLFGRGSWWSARLPNAMHMQKALYGYSDGLPQYVDVKRDVCSVYPELLNFSMRSPTLFLERFESAALLKTLAYLRDRNEIGLPIHDGIRVRRSIKTAALQLFERMLLEAVR